MLAALIIIFCVFAVFIIGGFLIRSGGREIHQQKMIRIAGKLGFHFCDSPPPEVMDKLKDFNLFHWGCYPRSLDWITGNYRDLRCYLFLRNFAFWTTRTSIPYAQTVAVISLDQRQLPHFSIHSRTARRASGEKGPFPFDYPVLGDHEIVLLKNDKFSSRYKVFGIQEHEVKKSLHQDTLDLLSNSQDDWHIELNGNVAMFYVINELWDINDIDRYMETVVQILKTLEK